VKYVNRLQHVILCAMACTAVEKQEVGGYVLSHKSPYLCVKIDFKCIITCLLVQG